MEFTKVFFTVTPVLCVLISALDPSGALQCYTCLTRGAAVPGVSTNISSSCPPGGKLNDTFLTTCEDSTEHCAKFTYIKGSKLVKFRGCVDQFFCSAAMTLEKGDRGTTPKCLTCSTNKCNAAVTATASAAGLAALIPVLFLF